MFTIKGSLSTERSDIVNLNLDEKEKFHQYRASDVETTTFNTQEDIAVEGLLQIVLNRKTDSNMICATDLYNRGQLLQESVIYSPNFAKQSQTADEVILAEMCIHAKETLNSSSKKMLKYSFAENDPDFRNANLVITLSGVFVDVNIKVGVNNNFTLSDISVDYDVSGEGLTVLVVPFIAGTLPE